MGYSTTDSNINISTPDWVLGQEYKKYDIINGSNTSVFDYQGIHTNFFIPAGAHFVVKKHYAEIYQPSNSNELVGYSKPFLLRDLSCGYALHYKTSSNAPQRDGRAMIDNNGVSNLPNVESAESIEVELELLSSDMTPIPPNIEKKIITPINEYAKIWHESGRRGSPSVEGSEVNISQVFDADYFDPNSRQYGGTYHDGGITYARIKITKTAGEGYATYRFRDFELYQLDEHSQNLYFYATSDHLSTAENSPFFHLGGLSIDSATLADLQPDSIEGGEKISSLTPTNWNVVGEVAFKNLFDGRKVCLMNASSGMDAGISTTMTGLEIGSTYRVDLSLNPVRETKFSYCNFSSGEPNATAGGQDYAVVQKSSTTVSGTWDDVTNLLPAPSESLKTGYIVQHGGPYSTNYEAVIFEDTETDFSWTNARTLARRNGYSSDLAVVLVPEQQVAFTNLINKLNAYSSYAFYIGLTDQRTDFIKGFSPDSVKIKSTAGEWLWIEGTPLHVVNNTPQSLQRDATSYSNSPYGATIQILGDNTDESDLNSYIVHHKGLHPGDYAFEFMAESENHEIKIHAVQPPLTMGIFEAANRGKLGLSDSLGYGDTISVENCIRLNRISVSKELSLWTRHFTPNPSYRSSVQLSGNNTEMEFGDGYTEIRPKNLNSVKVEAELNFDNRKDSEMRAIIHFMENTQGFKKLKYRLPSPFNKLQSFTCEGFSHTYNDYDDNSLRVKLLKEDAFILNRFNDFLMPHPGDWNATTPYFEGDICVHQSMSSIGEVDSPTSRAFYYAMSSSQNREPRMSARYWTKDHFFWAPSLGNSISRESRHKESSMENDFVARNSDGTFPNLMTLDLAFEGRSDFEARAIMHFLTNKMGHLPFLFNLPDPYSNLKTEPLRDNSGLMPVVSGLNFKEGVMLKGAPSSITLKWPLQTPSGSANPGHEILLKNQIITVSGLPSNKNRLYINKATVVNGTKTLEVYNPFYSVEDITGRELTIHVQQKAFYCDRWSMEYVSYDNNTINATFKEIAIATDLVSEFIDVEIGDDESNQYIDLSSY
tara:strand:+ start:3602 stop:6748 length:3147 start_codon:yes stop_codon:yes gene_type:complete